MKPNMDDVRNVTNYIVKYTCKGNETQQQEEEVMKSMILAQSEEVGGTEDMKKIARCA